MVIARNRNLKKENSFQSDFCDFFGPGIDAK
jgi:hypothetical protein